jgi:hypothetical protein
VKGGVGKIGTPRWPGKFGRRDLDDVRPACRSGNYPQRVRPEGTVHSCTVSVNGIEMLRYPGCGTFIAFYFINKNTVIMIRVIHRSFERFGRDIFLRRHGCRFLHCGNQNSERTASKLLFSQSLEPRRPEVSAEIARSLTDNFSAKQQKERAAPESWLSGSRR